MAAVFPGVVEPCPFLPNIGSSRFPASVLGVFREGPRGADFFYQALCCGQSRWLEGLPAQALLMLNRAMGARLDRGKNAELLECHPIPYRAVGWILRYGEAAGFIGNPRRHFQHLATRMSGHETELRVARAWACWELAKATNRNWQADEEQIKRESVTEPTVDQVKNNLARYGLAGEVDEWQKALNDV
jgi:hypothetical protein